MVAAIRAVRASSCRSRGSSISAMRLTLPLTGEIQGNPASNASAGRLTSIRPSRVVCAAVRGTSPGRGKVATVLESQRERVPLNDGGELDTALAFLSFARACVLKKVAGLDEGQLRRRLVVSETTLLGLVQHLTDAERYWFGYTLAGDPRFADVDFDMVVAPDRAADQVSAGYRTAIGASDAHSRAADD